MKSSMKSFLDKHKAFWNMENLGRPLLNFTGYTPMAVPLADGSMAAEGCYLTPDVLSPERIHPKENDAPFTYSWPYSIFHTREGGPARQVDVFLPLQPYSKVPWMEAMVGCKIRVGLRSNSMWSEPSWRDRWHDADKIMVPIHQNWLAKLTEFVKWCADNFFPSYLISNALMRGPVDMFEALVGIENMCIALHRQPRKSCELLNLLADVTIEVMRAQLEVIPSFHGGYCNPYGIWSPEKYVYLQADASHALSPRMYKEFLIPTHEKVTRNFDYSVIHLHSGPLYDKGVPFAKIIAEEESIRCIQVNIDPPPHTGPLVTNLLPLLSIIHEKKPLIVQGQFTQNELDRIAATLPAGGLYISSNYRPIELRST